MSCKECTKTENTDSGIRVGVDAKNGQIVLSMTDQSVKISFGLKESEVLSLSEALINSLSHLKELRKPLGSEVCE